MNLRGIAVRYLIGLFLGIFVLIIAILIIAGVIDYSIFLGDVAPSLNRTNGEFYGPEVLRYSILEDEVEFFTGAEWNDVSGEIILNDKKLDGVQVKSDFVNYYYGFSSREQIDIEIRKGAFYPDRPDIPPLRAAGLRLNKGIEGRDIFYFVADFRSKYNLDDTTSYGHITLVDGKKMFFTEKGGFTYNEKLPDEFTTFERDRFMRSATEWINSVFEKPIEISYEEKIGEDTWQDKTEKFDTEKIDEFIVVRLNERAI